MTPSQAAEVVSVYPTLPTSQPVYELTVTLNRNLTLQEQNNFSARMTNTESTAEVVFNLSGGKVMRVGIPDTEVGSYTINGSVITVSFNETTSISTFELLTA